MSYFRSVFLPVRILLIILGMSSVHLLGYIDQFSYSSFVFVDAVFIANFWFVFLFYCASASAFGAFLFYLFRGPFTLTVGYLVNRLSRPSDRRNLRVFVAGMRRGWWDAYIIAYISFSQFVYLYLDTRFILSFVVGLVPLLSWRISIHAGDSFLFVASRAARKSRLKRAAAESVIQAKAIGKTDWRPYWHGAEEWAGRRTFSLNAKSVYILVVLVAIAANILGGARAKMLMAKTNIEFENKQYADVGQNSLGIIVFDKESKKIFIVPEARVAVNTEGRQGVMTLKINVRWLLQLWQDDENIPLESATK